MKRITIAICALTAIVCLCFGAGCDKEDKSINVGSQIIEDNKIRSEIFGAKDLYLPITATDISGADADVYALKNGERLSVVADVSGIDFGTQGTYKIKWLCEGNSVEKNVYILGVPTITDSDDDGEISCTYSTVWSNIYKGLAAKDAFDNDINVYVYNDDGLYNLDGSLNVGTFTVKYGATDLAGQSVFTTRKITVIEERNPTIESSYSFDVADQSLGVILDNEDLNVFLGVSINGTALASDKFYIEDNTINISGAEICAFAPVGQKANVRVFTQKGQTTAELNVSDVKPLQFDDNDIVNFTRSMKVCGQSVSLPKIVMTNSYQVETPEYYIFDGVNKTAVTDTFTFDESGAFEYIVSARGEEYTYDIETWYDLGFKNGEVYDSTTGFDGVIKEGYTLKSYLVKYVGDDSFGIIKYENGHNTYGDLDTFKEKFKKLNTKYTYTLTVVGESIQDGKDYSQTIYFTTVGSGKAVLGASDVFLSANGTDTTLDYVSASIDGKYGVFHYNTITDVYADPNQTESGTKLSWSEEVLSVAKAGKYLTFDMFYTGNVLFRLYVDNGLNAAGNPTTRSLNFWGRYVTGQDYGKYQDDGSYVHEILSVYNFNGEKLSGKNDYFRSSSYYNKWITVQIKLPDDLKSGITLHKDTKLSDMELYIANVRISDNSLFEDTTVNGKVEGDNEVIMPDIFEPIA